MRLACSIDGVSFELLLGRAKTYIGMDKDGILVQNLQSFSVDLPTGAQQWQDKAWLDAVFLV